VKDGVRTSVKNGAKNKLKNGVMDGMKDKGRLTDMQGIVVGMKFMMWSSPDWSATSDTYTETRLSRGC